MHFFSDDSYLRTIKTSVGYLTKESLERTWATLRVSGVVMTKNELNNYALSFKDYYSYKFGIIAECKGEVIGFALFSDLETEVFLNHLYVSPLRRFQGIGSKIMSQVKKYAGNREISFIDTSNNYMPWMDTLNLVKKSELSRQLGSFYSK